MWVEKLFLVPDVPACDFSVALAVCPAGCGVSQCTCFPFKTKTILSLDWISLYCFSLCSQWNQIHSLFLFRLRPEISCFWCSGLCIESPARLLAVITKAGKSLASDLHEKPQKKETKKKRRKLIPKEISLDFAATAAIWSEPGFSCSKWTKIHALKAFPDWKILYVFCSAEARV